MGINAGFLDRADKITQEAKAAQAGSFGGEVWKLTLAEETPYDVVMLSEHTFTSQVHFFKGAPAELCNLMYYDAEDEDRHCEGCEKPGYQGKGNNRPSPVMLSIGYVLNLVGATGKSKNGKEFKHNPVKIIETTCGKKEVNFENLKEAIASDYFKWDPKEPNVWRYKRLAVGGIAQPSLLSTAELKKLPVKAEVPQEILDKYSKMSKEEVIGLLISPYGNLKKAQLEDFGIIFPKSKEEAPPADNDADDLDK
jgi:hypothetical protein